MTHDSLCPGWFDTVDGQMECDACELIAKVREDTLAAAVQRVEALLDTGNTAIATAIAAIKGESP